MRTLARRDRDDVVRFVLGPPRRGWEIAASIAGIAFFAWGLIANGARSVPSALFSSLALCSLLAALAYQYLGEEVIEIAAEEVRVKRTLFDLPIPRTASYPLASLEPIFMSAGEGGRRFNRIEMRVAAQRSWFAYAIDTAQAAEITATIAARKGAVRTAAMSMR